MHLAALRAPRPVETAIMGIDLWDNISRACDERGMSSTTLLLLATVCLCTGSCRSISSSKRTFFGVYPRFVLRKNIVGRFPQGIFCLIEGTPQDYQIIAFIITVRLTAEAG